MENNEMKEIIRKKVKEKIAVSNIRKEFDMKEKNRKKLMYSITSSAAVVILGVGIIVGTKTFKDTSINNNSYEIADMQSNENKDEKLNSKKENDKIIFNEGDGMLNADIDAEWHDSDLNKEFEFLNLIKVPNGYNKSRQGKMYVRESSTGEYTKLNQYSSIYSLGNENNTYIEVEFSEGNDILICLHVADLDNYEYSIISETNVKLIQSKSVIDGKINGEAIFECNGYKFYIHAYGIEENELVTLVKSIIEGTTK